MEALESFRAEELSAQEAQRREREVKAKSWIGKRGSDPGFDTPRDSGMPELDSHHRELAEAVLGTPTPKPRKTAPPRRAAGPDIAQYMGYFGIAAAALVIAVVGYFFVSNYIEQQRQAQAVVYPNDALAMLDRGEPPLVALREAIDAVKNDPSQENRRIADQVREVLIDQVNSLLNSDPWRRENLDEASQIATNAAGFDADRRIQELAREVDQDVAAYKLVATTITAEGTQATFKLHNPNYPKSEETVAVGDWVQDRFIVKKVLPTYVRLEDTKRRAAGGHRTVIARVNSLVTGE